MGVNRGPSRRSGPSNSSYGSYQPGTGVPVRRRSQPSGPWEDQYGNLCKSPSPGYSSPPEPKKKKAKVDGNPDPDNWKIIKAKEYGKYLLLEMHYPDCTNYEGKKILVFENVSLVDIVNQRQIDPHFFPANPKFKSPIARFEPTPRGWTMAEGLIKSLLK